MELSQPAEWVNKPFIGYVVNAEFSSNNADALATITQEIQATFQDAVFCAPRNSLHITLLDWIAPLVDYDGQDKATLFARIKPSYDTALQQIVSTAQPIVVVFDEIRISPSTIYLVGHDNGQFESIRQQFVANVELLPGTKLPPQIIHSSLARFTKPIDLDLVRSFIASRQLHLTENITSFRLVHTTREPLLEFEVLKRYELHGQI